MGQQQMPQVLFAEHDDMIETFSADRADQALGVGILPLSGRMRRDAKPKFAAGGGP
jgi:hypothetical protein